MGVMGHYTTLSLILLFTLDVFTDIANGIELILNDHVVCKYQRERETEVGGQVDTVLL